MNDASQVVDNTLATVIYATRCAVSTLIQTTPGGLVYRRDMMMDIPLKANLTPNWDS